MSLMNTLTDDMKTAMKSGDKSRLSALRMLVSAVRYVGIDSGEMTDDKVIEVLTREAKKRKESVLAYRNAGREEQARAEEYEIGVINEYLPTMMSEEEIRTVVESLKLKDKSNGNMGMAIGIAMKELKGKADGGMVSRIIREMYTNPK